jgi:hypothetical protein
LDPYISPYTKFNSKKIKNVKLGSINLLEENMEEKLYGIGYGNDFRDMTLKAQTTKAKIDKWDYLRSSNM